MKPTEVNLALALEQIEGVRQDLWATQLRVHPDSVRLAPNDVINILYRKDLDPQDQRWLGLAAIEDPVGVFYKCGLQGDGSYRWLGFRYGVEDHQHHSGFGARP